MYLESDSDEVCCKHLKQPFNLLAQEDRTTEAGKEDDMPMEEFSDMHTEVLDSRGILGWDTVEKLAKALLSLKGLSMSEDQAKVISSLYDQLDSHNKKPLVYSKRYSHKTRGWFAISRGRLEDVSIHYLKRYTHSIPLGCVLIEQFRCVQVFSISWVLHLLFFL